MQKQLFLLLTLFVMSLHASEKPIKKHIVIDVMNTIVETDMLVTARYLGFLSLFSTWFNSFGQNPSTTLIPEFFSLLRSIDPQPPAQEVRWQNEPAPNLIYESLTNKKKPDEILKQVQEGLNTCNTPRKNIMKRLAEITFDPTINTNMMKSSPDAIDSLRNLRGKFHTVHIVANWNKEAAQQLKHKFPDSFYLVNGAHYFSGDLGHTKHEKTFKKLMQEYDINETDLTIMESCPHMQQHLQKHFPESDILQFD